MEYVQDVLDRRTGLLTTVSLGEWITISELADLCGVGRRSIRTILRKMEVLQVEGASSHQRHRLASWVVERGWGRRIEKRGAVPFDVVGPELREWIDARWKQTTDALDEEKTKAEEEAGESLRWFNRQRLNGELTVQEAVSWLADHFPALTQREIANVLNVTQQLVSKFLNIRREQRRAARTLLAMPMEERQRLRSAN